MDNVFKKFREEFDQSEDKSTSSKLKGAGTLNNEILNKIVEENESEASHKSEE